MCNASMITFNYDPDMTSRVNTVKLSPLTDIKYYISGLEELLDYRSDFIRIRNDYPHEIYKILIYIDNVSVFLHQFTNS